MPETTATERDERHLLRSIELAARARGHDQPEPARGGRDREGRPGDRRGLPRRPPASRTPSARRSPPAARTRPGPRSTCRSSPAPTTAAPRPARRRSSRRASRAWWSPPTIPRRRPPAAASGILRDEGIQVDIAGRRARRTRRGCSTSPSASTPRTGRPLVLLQVGDDARRQGRHPDRRLAVDLGRGRAAPARTAGAPSRTPWRWASAPRCRTTRCSPRASRAWPASRAAWCSTPRRACPLASQLVQSVNQVPVTWSARAPPRARTCEALEAAGVEVIVATGENEAARVARALSTSSARAASSRCCSRAARTWPAPSSTPARSTRCACSSPRAGRRAPGPHRVEGQGVEDDRRRATRALTSEVERIDGRRADHRAAERSGDVHGSRAGSWARCARSSASRRRAPRGRDLARRRAAEGDSIAVNGVCLTAVSVGGERLRAPT